MSGPLTDLRLAAYNAVVFRSYHLGLTALFGHIWAAIVYANVRDDNRNFRGSGQLEQQSERYTKPICMVRSIR
jgi:hypothetical protein